MSEQSKETARKKRPWFRIASVGVIGVLALVLVLQNTETVETRFLFATISMPRAVLLFITFLLGMVAGFLTGFLRKRQGRK